MGFIGIYPVKLAPGHIPAQIQQLPDSGCRLLPGKERGAGALGAFAFGNADSLGIVPESILFAVQIKARAVFSIVFRKEPGVVRLILFEISAMVRRLF